MLERRPRPRRRPPTTQLDSAKLATRLAAANQTGRPLNRAQPARNTARPPTQPQASRLFITTTQLWRTKGCARRRLDTASCGKSTVFMFNYCSHQLGSGRAACPLTQVGRNKTTISISIACQQLVLFWCRSSLVCTGPSGAQVVQERPVPGVLQLSYLAVCLVIFVDKLELCFCRGFARKKTSSVARNATNSAR